MINPDCNADQQQSGNRQDNQNTISLRDLRCHPLKKSARYGGNTQGNQERSRNEERIAEAARAVPVIYKTHEQYQK